MTFHKRRSFSLAFHNSVQKQGLPTHFISKGLTLKIIATYFQSNKIHARINICVCSVLCTIRGGKSFLRGGGGGGVADGDTVEPEIAVKHEI